MANDSNEPLRRDVRMLGGMLGEIITDQKGAHSLQLVEEIRKLARSRRAGDMEAEGALEQRIRRLTREEAETVVRAFTVYFDLANLAEDRHRVRVLRERERAGHDSSESIEATVARFREMEMSADQVREALHRLAIEMVFTAHPSEAKRRAVRAKLARMREALRQLDDSSLLARERAELETLLRTEMTVLWETDFLRPWRPTVLEEVDRCLAIAPRLWQVTPEIFRVLRTALAQHYPEDQFEIPIFLRFGSWVGGDRDGHPDVTAAVTEKTLLKLRNTAVELQLAECRRMTDFLSVSAREVPVDRALEQGIDAAAQRWPELQERLAAEVPTEVYRRFLKVIEWRLEQTFLRRGEHIPRALCEGAYRDGEELEAGIRAILDSLEATGHDALVSAAVRQWLDLTRMFGLHYARLDVRQDSRLYLGAMSEILRAAKVSEVYENLPEAEKVAVLAGSIPFTGELPEDALSPEAREVLAVFRLLERAVGVFGPASIGGHVISMTKTASDVLAVLWLWRWAQASAGSYDENAPGLPIIPLFEKIADLQRAAATMGEILAQPVYTQRLAKQGNRQIVMLGYSDSTKDGGYLAACWNLYRAQTEIGRVMQERGIALTYFHGRGGSLGRGGGPAARSILSLPPASLDGTLRLTEQGEVLAERYDDPQIAHRHLEQVTSATLLGSMLSPPAVKPEWIESMEQLAQRSYAFYREMVDLPGFLEFFAIATPIEEIEDLPIGSRPARRKGKRTLEDLRAIPWVFSWTQNRCLIPAWYGLGTALTEVKYSDRASWMKLREMYGEWRFFAATIDNAALALAKADTYIAQCYAELSTDIPLRQRFWTLIASERDRTRQAILDMTGEAELLSGTPWFRSSVEVRNPYIDPLNLIQIEMMRRKRGRAENADESELEALKHLLRLTVQGVAAGMRTTG